jgi:hypothetical protein
VGQPLLSVAESASYGARWVYMIKKIQPVVEKKNST